MLLEIYVPKKYQEIYDFIRERLLEKCSRKGLEKERENKEKGLRARFLIYFVFKHLPNRDGRLKL